MKEASGSKRAWSGFGYAMLSALSFALMAYCASDVSRSLPMSETAFARAALGCVLLAPWLLANLRVLLTPQVRFLVLRALAGCASALCYFYTLSSTTAANARALADVAPLFVVGLGWRLLGEVPTRLQLGLIALGVMGTTCLGLPGARSCPRDVWLVGIAGALFAALAYYSLRKISALFPTSVTVFAFMLVLALVAAVLPDRSWVVPTRSQWVYLTLVGIFGLFGQLWLTASFARLPAFLASVLNLATLPLVCLLELVLDHHWPSAIEWLAYGLILCSVALNSIFQPAPTSND